MAGRSGLSWLTWLTCDTSLFYECAENAERNGSIVLLSVALLMPRSHPLAWRVGVIRAVFRAFAVLLTSPAV